MTGRTVLITGPTSGLGLEMARQLAAQGARLLLVCRDGARGETTADELRRRHPGVQAEVLTVDMARPQAVRALAARVRERVSRLDVLLNNAGLNRRARQETPEGIELTFAANVLGPHLLSLELLELLKSSTPSRIVNVASTFARSLDLEDLQFTRRPYEGREAYAQSKACNRLLSWALARRLEGSGVTVNAMAPGLVQTRLFRDTPFVTRQMVRLAGLFFGRSVEQGADTAVWLASSPEVADRSGGFYSVRREIPCEYRDEAREERLWTGCERLLDGARQG
jgi:NAD(P)-dependent dehydrogenase (short-subunit alcohol dehydrogenase family)